LPFSHHEAFDIARRCVVDSGGFGDQMLGLVQSPGEASLDFMFLINIFLLCIALFHNIISLPKRQVLNNTV
jgi:hypothetical protein